MMHLKMSVFVVICIFLLTLLTDVNFEANSVDPDQTDMGPHCLSKRLLKKFSRQQKQTTFVVIGPLRVINSHMYAI